MSHRYDPGSYANARAWFGNAPRSVSVAGVYVPERSRIVCLRPDIASKGSRIVCERSRIASKLRGTFSMPASTFLSDRGTFRNVRGAFRKLHGWFRRVRKAIDYVKTELHSIRAERQDGEDDGDHHEGEPSHTHHAGVSHGPRSLRFESGDGSEGDDDDGNAEEYEPGHGSPWRKM